MDCWGGSLENGTDPCTLNKTASSAVWACFGVIWTVVTVVSFCALRLVTRVRSRQPKVEPRVLLVVLGCGLCFAALGFYKCSHPAKTAIGYDAVSTGLFAFGCALLFLFLLFTPLNPSGTGITSFALKRQRNLSRCYHVCFPITVVLATFASFLPYLGLFSRDLLSPALTATFAVFGICIALVCAVDIYVVHRLRRDFRVALKTKRHEMSESHRKGIGTIVESTGKVDIVMGFTGAMTVLTCALIAIGIEPVREACWLLIPLLLLIACGWIARYVLFSRYVSLRAFNRQSRQSELPTSTRGRLSLFNDKSDSGSSSQIHLASITKRVGRKQSKGSSSGGVTFASEPTIYAGTPRRKGRRFKNSRFSSIQNRPLTRVEEADYEGTIISKFEQNELVSIKNHSSSGNSSKAEKT